MPEQQLFSVGEKTVWNFAADDCSQWQNQRLFEYWQEKKQGRRFPSRRDIDPLDMVYALPHVSLVNVFRDPLRFQGRLIGTRIVERSGFDLTGKWVEEVPLKEFRELLLRRLGSIIERAAPLLVCNKQFYDDRWYNYEVVWLPLAENGEDIDMIMSCQIFLPDAAG